MAGLDLWLDSYDNIYSDFDSRHYPKRRISEDFLYELRTELKFKNEHAEEIVLFLPQNQRNETSEKTISESLNYYFTTQFLFHRKKCRKMMIKGWGFLVLGCIIMILNTWISFYEKGSILMISLKVILEPAGWFLLWTSFDFLFYDFFELKKERDFYGEIKEMKIFFKSS